MVRNVHERLVAAPLEEVGPLLDRLGGPDDVLWPNPAWMPMELDGPVAVGAAGRHGAIRYRVTAHEPGRRVEFTVDPGVGVDGTHTFTAERAGPGTLLRHTIDGRTRGAMRLGWPLGVRWLHDALLEDLLDNAERATGREPGRPARWSPWVHVLTRVFVTDRAHPVPVPGGGGLLANALPRVDWADAHAVRARPGTPDDPQVWADAIFRDPPLGVLALLGLRELLVGLVGIERGGSGAFDTVDRADGEVLLGSDAGHLDFRASVRRRRSHVVLTTVVRVHNRRGRAYSAVVRRVHPYVVRAMLTHAAHRLSRSSNRGAVARPMIPA
ncbi:hypothetical protein BJF78_05365 [Pseudonocardia sp. CNS-139]|nr:hypothetical protein BJF78_05365 [Pseudonocardia sp. CNS-139]